MVTEWLAEKDRPFLGDENLLVDEVVHNLVVEEEEVVEDYIQAEVVVVVVVEVEAHF